MLEPPHQVDLGRAARQVQERALLQAHAVFGRDRSAHRLKGSVDDVLDRPATGWRDLGQADDQMQIAVAQVAEDGRRSQIRPTRRQLRLHRRDIGFHRRDRQADVEGDDRPVARRLGDVVAQGPHRLALGLGAGDSGVGDLAGLEGLGQGGFEPGRVAGDIAAQALDQNIERVAPVERRAAPGRRARDQVVETGPHHLEGRQQAAEISLQTPQQLRQRRKALDADDGGVLADRRGAQAQHRAGDHPQGAFRADEQLLEVVAGVVLDQRAHGLDHRPVGEHGLQAQDHVAHHAVAQDAVAARVGGDRAADRGRTTRAEIQRQQQAFGGRGLAGGLQDAAGLDGHGSGDRVYRLDGGHAVQRQGQGAVGQAAVDQTGAPAPRNHRGARRRRQTKNLGHGLGRRGPQHRQGRAQPGPGTLVALLQRGARQDPIGP
ncbi:hypothetical protein ASD38_19730 [Caulobacter sp. Root487D2Y]|nr:hypothetical protein ASD38_19730 [Caulobacter sp. Root487D2Y]